MDLHKWYRSCIHEINDSETSHVYRVRCTPLKQNMFFLVYVLTLYLSEMGGGNRIGKAEKI
jgi:hypothetical protein